MTNFPFLSSGGSSKRYKPGAASVSAVRVVRSSSGGAEVQAHKERSDDATGGYGRGAARRTRCCAPSMPRATNTLYLLVHELGSGRSAMMDPEAGGEVVVRVACACGKVRTETASSPCGVAPLWYASPQALLSLAAPPFRAPRARQTFCGR